LLRIRDNRDVYPGSRILMFIHPGYRISDPGYRISDPGYRISDPGSKNSTKRGRGKKLFLAKTLRIIVLFTHKFVIKLSKIWVCDSGSEIRIRKKPIQDHGSRVKKAPDPRSGSATLVLLHEVFVGGSTEKPRFLPTVLRKQTI
jgi:hypothetical protein